MAGVGRAHSVHAARRSHGRREGSVTRFVTRSLFASAVALFTYLLTVSAALAVDEFTVPTPGSNPAGLTAGPDASLWFTEENTSANKIGRITTGGVFTVEVAAPTPAPPPASGPPP